MNQLTINQYLHAAGTIFEQFLNQDSGNISYSLHTADGPIWIKILDLASTPLEDLNGIIRFYNACQSKLIPKNWSLIELSDGTIMQHDWVPGRVLHSPDENRHAATSTYSKFMALPLDKRVAVFEQIMVFFVELERQNIIIEDFYDGCILYDFENDILHLIDLDHIHNGPYQLQRDRQLGSRRFMAPEEFQKGSQIDQQTNVYTLGATGFNILNLNRRSIEDWPYPSKWHTILTTATATAKADRFTTVAELHHTWMNR